MPKKEAGIACHTWRRRQGVRLPDTQAHEQHTHREPPEDADRNNRFEGHTELPKKKVDGEARSNGLMKSDMAINSLAISMPSQFFSL